MSPFISNLKYLGGFEDKNGMKNLFNDLVQFKKGLNQVNIFLSDSKSLLMNGEACKDNSAEIVFNGDTISI